ncbi:hypothetical protein [Acidisoma sp. L85]|uniref:hypothetical protein n=1 Tax=Acidisoma sp. L85 TaxID=1641850 RepID=UPI00131C99CD|nr:hypothetical protein [Acidisoma sp. L85]
MSDVQAGSASSTSKDVADDLAVLKSDVAALIKEMKDLAIREGSRIGQNAAEKISGSASDIYGGCQNKLSVPQRLSVSMFRTGPSPVC